MKQLILFISMQLTIISCTTESVSHSIGFSNNDTLRKSLNVNDYITKAMEISNRDMEYSNNKIGDAIAKLYALQSNLLMWKVNSNDAVLRQSIELPPRGFLEIKIIVDEIISDIHDSLEHNHRLLYLSGRADTQNDKMQFVKMAMHRTNRICGSISYRLYFVHRNIRGSNKH